MRARDNVTVVLADVTTLIGVPAYDPAFEGFSCRRPSINGRASRHLL
jgi:hypothetical protein